MDGNKKLYITGLTGTGKTSLAVRLAKELGLSLISADARQVYKQLDIGTGKYSSDDLWEEFPSYSLLNGIQLFGVNLIDPSETFSANQFREYSQNLQTKQNNLITVGGTGFYINACIAPPQYLSIDPDSELRNLYAQKQQELNLSDYVEFLQKELEKINSNKLNSMNNSDIHNPRRLVRAIEIAKWQNSQANHIQHNSNSTSEKASVIVLDANKEYLQEKIRSRVKIMIEMGLETEVRQLVSIYGWTAPGLTTMGYIEWQQYFEGTSSLDQVIESITMHHLQYARKQRIYAKHIANAKWFDVSIPQEIEIAYNYCIEELKKATIRS